MPTNQDKEARMLSRMRAIFDEEVPTRQEFVDSFKNVIDYVKKMEGTLSKDISDIADTLKKLADQVKADTSSSIEEVKLTASQLKQLERTIEKSVTDKMASVDAKMDSVKDGQDADEEKIVSSVLSMMPTPKDGSPDTSEQIRNKLETLKDEDRLDASAIKGLEKLIKKQKVNNVMTPAVIPTGGGVVKAYDLSTSLNGVLTTFSLPAFWRIISVHLSSTPNILRPTTDYTIDGSVFTITFTSEITAATQLSTGQTLIIVYAE